ncbi:MAG: hypothetical protein Q6K55_07815 [Thermostichus sp. DG02_3_bins_51]
MSGYDTGGRRSSWSVGKAKQADALLEDLFKDLERSFEEGLEQLEEYPYFGTRPPLFPRRSYAAAGMLLGMASAATCVAGLVFWMSLRPQALVFLDEELLPSVQERGGLPSDPLPDSFLEQELATQLTAEDQPEVTAEKGENSANPNPSVTTTTATATAPASTRVAASVVSAPSASVAPPVRIPPQPVPQMKLVGLIHDPGAPKALILIDNVVRQVPVGHPVKGEWRVTSISPYGVAVSNGAQSVTLQLGLTQRV